MFRNLAEFTGFKATELNNFLEDVTSEKQAARRESGTTSRLDEMLMKVPTEPLVLWIDKVCGGRYAVVFLLSTCCGTGRY